MRHRNKVNNLSRTASHRAALLKNLANALIEHKAIRTTLPKAKALRKYVEPLLTKSKSDTTHSRRVIFSYLHNKESIKVLFGDIAPRIMDRPGGYTRILKLGPRPGDNAEMAYIELVDFNEYYTKADSGKKSRRRGAKKKAGADTAAASKADPAPAAVVEEVPPMENAPEIETGADAAAEGGEEEKA
ncbi:MAG: 50S ribosomal protein L17 [Bacteroidetes bacterium]|nr:50S ribosomal protein L17 [Bacteroidota bacterium]